MAVRVIHMADVHLGSTFRNTGNLSSCLNAELECAFSETVRTAQTSDFLLISGDLFDSNYPSRNLIRYVKNTFAEIADTPVLICGGNHDDVFFQQVFAQYNFGENVHVFTENFNVYETPKADIYGVSDSFVNSCGIPQIVIRNPSKINILLLHATIGGSDYRPVTVKDIANSGFDYIALGHIHNGTEIMCAENSFYAYSGCLCPRGFDESGVCGALALNIDKHKVEGERINFTQHFFDTIVQDVQDITYERELVEVLRSQFCENNLTRIRLVGETPYLWDTQRICAALGGFYVKVIDDTTLSPLQNEETDAYSLKSLFFAQAEKEEDSPAVRYAKRIGLSLFGGGHLD